MVSEKWNYSSDVNLSYGGEFFDLSTFFDGYCDCVRVTDLDGACGFTGAALIEHITANVGRKPDELFQALRGCSGYSDLEAKALSWAIQLFWNHEKLPKAQSESEQPFLDEISENPDEIGPKLVFADWLEEHCDLRAQFIRQLCDDDESKRIQNEIAYACVSYGYSDPDDSWDNYRSHHTEIVQCESDGPMEFDGWRADKRIANTTLEAYVESVHLS